MPLRRNGFALLKDLEDPIMRKVQSEMLSFQERFTKDNVSLLSKLKWPLRPLNQWSRQWEYPYVLLNSVKTDKAIILDAGSGLTFFPFYLLSKGYIVHCCDMDKVLESMFLHINTRSCSQSKNIHFRTCSLNNLAYPDEYFDEVFCISVLEHTSNHREIIEEFYRVLKPGGRLVLTCDVSLDGTKQLTLFSLERLLDDIGQFFTHLYPVVVDKNKALLATDYFRKYPEKLPWKRRGINFRNILHLNVMRRPFFSLGVVGFTLEKRRNSGLIQKGAQL